MAAARLHQRLDLRARADATGGAIDVFGAMQSIGLPLLLRPLDGLLGAYLSTPSPGVLVTTLRSMSIQRFTAAHELGHFSLGHEPSLDDDDLLRRAVGDDGGADGRQEVEADAFAAEFLMPKWLIAGHMHRQGWTMRDLADPAIVYQLSLRVGGSYQATVHTLARQRLVSAATVAQLLAVAPKTLKDALLGGARPKEFRGDVWLLTERDAGTRVDGARTDLFVLRLKEHSGGGYLWDVDQLKASGFVIQKDEREGDLDLESFGGHVIRRVTAAPATPRAGVMLLSERRPWERNGALSRLELNYDLTGPEEAGLSRAERRTLLEAA